MTWRNHAVVGELCATCLLHVGVLQGRSSPQGGWPSCGLNILALCLARQDVAPGSTKGPQQQVDGRATFGTTSTVSGLSTVACRCYKNAAQAAEALQHAHGGLIGCEYYRYIAWSSKCNQRVVCAVRVLPLQYVVINITTLQFACFARCYPLHLLAFCVTGTVQVAWPQAWAHDPYQDIYALDWYMYSYSCDTASLLYSAKLTPNWRVNQ